ncbi:transposase family protein [Streptomyces mirabilis]|uniref:transposase family protein n=1 Tax=Streptomyces mirabilis TaxID=68239 RepID=UPI0033FB152D
MSGKKKQNTAKTTTISDSSGRLLWSGADRPGRMHDQTAVRAEGIAEQLRLYPKVKAEADEGFRGLATEFPDQVSAPPKKPEDDAPLGERHAWREHRRRQASRRIRGEHTIGGHKEWRRCSGTSDGAITSPRPTRPSPARTRTAPPAGPAPSALAPIWCLSVRPPADHAPADLPGQHVPTSIVNKVVGGAAD